MPVQFNHLLPTIVLVVILVSCKQIDNNPVKLEGHAFGTTFHITYYDNNHHDYSKSIDSLFYLINKSLSTYIPNSDISKINKGDSGIVTDTFFREVYHKSDRIFKETRGVFDPTIGILVNAWGFGPEGEMNSLDSNTVRHLLHYVGFEKVRLQHGKIVKNDSTYFDFNAIAKGYAVDVAGRFLEKKNITDYLVEIGGEVRCKGSNILKNANWKIGIEDPNFDGTRSIRRVVELQDEAIATSGSYRKFKIDSLSGRRYVHILNTKTGYPVQSRLLSVSVIGELDCADVDGYATAIMAMSLKDAKQFFDDHPELKGFLIYNDEDNALQTFTTSNF